MYQKESYATGNYFRGSVKATVNIKPVTGLKVSGFAAIEEGDNNGYWYNGVVNTDASGSEKAGRSGNTSLNKLFELTADWTRNFNGHSIAVVAGVSYQNFFYDSDNMANKGFAAPAVMKYYKMGDGDASKKYMEMGSDRNSHTLIAQFARVNYNYREKYLLSASLRREGSSRFGINHKWGLFPAVSAGWRISGEDFMKNATWVDDLKLRAGFGVTGNDLGSDLRSVELLSNGGTFWYGDADSQAVYAYGSDWQSHLSEFSNVSYNSPSAVTGSFDSYGEVITYERETYDYFLGAKANFTFLTRFTAFLDFGFSVFTQINSIDHHILRDGTTAPAYFFDEMSGFLKSFTLASGMDVKIWKGLSCGAGFKYTYIAQLKGTDKGRRDRENQYVLLDADAGASGYFYNVELFVRYSF